MKKSFLLTLMTVMLTCTVGAQVKPIVLGDKHAMLKMEQSPLSAVACTGNGRHRSHRRVRQP